MLRLGLFASIFAMSGAATRAETIGPPLDLSHYAMIFDEDFDSLDVSVSGNTRWTTHTPWHGDFGDARFADPGADTPFQIHDGILSIEARKTPDGKWQSGLLSTLNPAGQGFAVKYGYFEIRAKLPAGKGVWPSFWLDSFQAGNTTDPTLEVDVFEQYGNFPGDFHATVHLWPSVEEAKTQKEKWGAEIIQVPPGSMSSDFHTYGADVEPDWITFYYDREPRWRYPTPVANTGKLGVLVNLALGSGWPIDETPNPSVMLIDYIRVWQKTP